MVKEKQEDNIEEKKMRKEEMENDNVVTCHSLQKKQRENTEEIEEKKMRKEVMENTSQCGNMSFPAEETKGKHRRNWYRFISTPYSAKHDDHHTRGHTNCLTIYIMKKLQEVKSRT